MWQGVLAVRDRIRGDWVERSVIGDYRTVLNREGLGNSVSAQEFFTPPVFDVLWKSQQRGDIPYPLRIPSHGATEQDRVVLRDRVYAELNARQLCDASGGLEPRIESWLGMLSRPALSVDALHIPAYEADPIGVLAASGENEAVLAIQDNDGVWIRPIYPDALVSSVLDVLPPADRGTAASVSLPLDEALGIQPDTMPAVGGAQGDSEEVAGKRGKRKQQRSLADRSHDPRQVYAQLVGQPRLAGGQLAANSRSIVGSKQRSSVLSWFDTATGRYLSVSAQGSDDSEWLTISPADTRTLRGRLSEMLESVRRTR